jgi:hypothetical protein
MNELVRDEWETNKPCVARIQREGLDRFEARQFQVGSIRRFSDKETTNIDTNKFTWLWWSKTMGMGMGDKFDFEFFFLPTIVYSHTCSSFLRNINQQLTLVLFPGCSE